MRSELTDKTWNKIFNREYYENDDGKLINDGLLALDGVMQKYYNRARKELRADKRLMVRFINADNEKLSTVLSTRKTKETAKFQKQRSVASQYD